MSSDEVALITPLDITKKIVMPSGKTVVKYYDLEALKCFKMWRKNGGKFKDSKIYALSFNESSEYSEEYLKQLQDLGVVTIFDDAFIGSVAEKGFENEVRTGFYFEQVHQIPEDILIKIDLDMQLLKPLEEALLEKARDSVLIGQYDKMNARDQRHLDEDYLPFDTSFIACSKKIGFYKAYLQEYHDPSNFDSNEWKSIIEKHGEYFKIEYAVDCLARKHLVQILPLQHHQFGEGYRNIDFFTREEAMQIRFLHQHLRKSGDEYYDGYDPVDQWMKYLKKTR